MPRSDDDDRPVRRRRQPDDSFGGHFLTGFLVGGAALGASIAIIGGVFWLAFRQPDLSEKEKERREAIANPPPPNPFAGMISNSAKRIEKQNSQAGDR